MMAMSRAFSWVIVEMMLKMPKPATSMIAPTTVYMMTLRTTSASRMRLVRLLPRHRLVAELGLGAPRHRRRAVGSSSLMRISLMAFGRAERICAFFSST